MKSPPHKPRAGLDELLESYGEVQLATLVKEAPAGARWTYELKFDGYRIVAVKTGAEVRLVSRRGQDWTREFEPIARAVAKLAVPMAVLDGEVCAVDAKGIPSFHLLQNRRASGTRLAYFVFDLLCEHGEDVRARRLEERRRRLAEILEPVHLPPSLVLSKALATDPARVLEVACRTGFEGIVAKAKDSPYVPGRSRTWLKIKCSNRQEFAIVGWLPLLKTKPLVGSLLLALVHDDGRFHFAGKVGTGFDDRTRKSLFELLSKDTSDAPTADDVPRFGGLVRFVVPRHVAEVAFSEWTGGGHVRHPSFQGLRTDKKPRDCVREKAEIGPA